jgi:elongator complex protein 3
MMPGLPGSTPEKDLKDFRKLFEDPRLRPDMLKIYPTLLLRDTGLAKLYAKGLYKPYQDDVLTDLLLEMKKTVPSWVRIMRIQREIESENIINGHSISNIRQILQKKLREQGLQCNCIRCREVGIRNVNDQDVKVDLKRFDYDSSDGKEVFLSLEDSSKKVLFGYLRLRKLARPHRKELTDRNGKPSAIVRELHVLGQLVDIGRNNDFTLSSSQHKGYGSTLLEKAEDIVKNEFATSSISIISAIGTRQYYKKFGYELNGPYVTKEM